MYMLTKSHHKLFFSMKKIEMNLALHLFSAQISTASWLHSSQSLTYHVCKNAVVTHATFFVTWLKRPSKLGWTEIGRFALWLKSWNFIQDCRRSIFGQKKAIVRLNIQKRINLSLKPEKLVYYVERVWCNPNHTLLNKEGLMFFAMQFTKSVTVQRSPTCRFTRRDSPARLVCDSVSSD